MSASFALSQLSISKQVKPSATIYVIGNIKEGYLQGVNAAYCKWETIYNEKNWMVEKGEQSGQSWIAQASKSDSKCVWSHSFDLEFRCKSVSGAPKLYVEVYSSNKTIDFYGYGIIHIPTHRGKHKVSIPIFRPCGSTKHWISSLLFGGNIRYRDPKEILLNTQNKFPHKTMSCGYIDVEINILKKGFPKYVEFDAEK